MEMSQFLGRKHIIEVFETDVSSLRTHLGKSLIANQHGLRQVGIWNSVAEIGRNEAIARVILKI